MTYSALKAQAEKNKKYNQHFNHKESSTRSLQPTVQQLEKKKVITVFPASTNKL